MILDSDRRLAHLHFRAAYERIKSIPLFAFVIGALLSSCRFPSYRVDPDRHVIHAHSTLPSWELRVGEWPDSLSAARDGWSPWVYDPRTFVPRRLLPAHQYVAAWCEAVCDTLWRSDERFLERKSFNAHITDSLKRSLPELGAAEFRGTFDPLSSNELRFIHVPYPGEHSISNGRLVTARPLHEFLKPGHWYSIELYRYLVYDAPGSREWLVWFELDDQKQIRQWHEHKWYSRCAGGFLSCKRGKTVTLIDR